jgi:hypothetical protein
MRPCNPEQACLAGQHAGLWRARRRRGTT